MGSNKVLSVATQLGDEAPALVAAFVSALILLTILFGFICQYSVKPFSAGDILRMTLTQIHSDQGPSHLLPMLIIPAWIGSCFALNADVSLRRSTRTWVAPFFISLLLSGLIAGAYAWLKAAQICDIGAIPDSYASARSDKIPAIR